MDLIKYFDNGLILKPADFDIGEDEIVFDFLFNELRASSDRHLDADIFLPKIADLLSISESNECRLKLNQNFFIRFPEFITFIKNMNTSADVEVACCEKIRLLDEPDPEHYNCMKLKSISNELHNGRWLRERNLSERQGGVSVLGGISEKLLKNELENLVSDDNYFYKSSSMQPQIRSYGDFVLMCQPNNLWMSVKSAFSRERLLASGYTNDVIGVGFFQSAKEFTNIKRLKNFKKAGFLAIYLPDQPVTEEQVLNNTNTYEDAENAYHDLGTAMPKNINETPLLRKLSDLYGDLKKITDMDLMKRNLSDF